ncbi:LacI family DNA-binding transcriptional regulator [Cohnella lubricantis]|uniref:LacI family DNA-binding transcriptional regulator n=1 Tax=Cohnella lubricantis TaxID=2163172 RepID=A0A841TBC8_9BACL|nr:LacI family DNA-binding transcriptional regulator [Cohnella lubricantis]MBB6675731.1 LacI family DNA-binding transcriptional regulator [Cohnella lubricantis]MBP2118875.1 LacI family transcriptional regulator/LacI family purine nucleotide synthesis repressor [Cohnella lubricantis]
MKQVTVYDIAKEAKVSVATVSRVLNGTAPVRASTRAKIEAIMHRHQFQPNALARSLSKKETGIIGVILPDITNSFFPEVFSGIMQEGQETGYTFFLCDTMGQYDKESEFLNIMREKRVDGILFMGGRINLNDCDEALVQEVMEHANKIPLVLVNGNLKNANLTRVATDEYAGTMLAVRHLIELGHTRIGFIGGESHMATTMVKMRAYRKCLREAGLPIREEWVLPDDFSVDAGNRQMQRLLSQTERPTAVCCVNDFTAIGAMKTAIDQGMRVPDDISIVGFDDIVLARHFIPELTTVSQQASELGRTAVQVLRQLINQERVKKLTSLSPRLVIRQSTASPRSE